MSEIDHISKIRVLTADHRTFHTPVVLFTLGKAPVKEEHVELIDDYISLTKSNGQMGDILGMPRRPRAKR